MAELGASVVLVGRDERRLEEARAEIVRRTGSSRIEIERADLSLVAETSSLADRLLATHGRVHGLINNAGALFRERGLTAEGLEQTFALNLLSPYLLTERLIPRLVDSAPARIVTVSSGGMYTERIQTADLQSVRPPYKGAAAYARAKRGQVILTDIWADRLAPHGVAVHAMHPGWADTPGVADSLPGFRRAMRPLLRTADEGADTIVWLMAAPEGQTPGSRFWLDRTPQPKHLVERTKESAAARQELVSRLQELSLRLGATARP
jgi:NAD(P)-dependent dehydrogenase (short-subunit alcohol dehydrogenase family)